MPLDPALCYQAVLARDRRYDGRFFTCVKSTGIYCRPICPARPPLLKHCEFVPSASAAQQAGYRPCLRCRPESSPGMGAWCGTSAVVQRALSLIEMGALDEGDVTNLAERLGLGDRHLRRLFQQHLGTTPMAVAQTRRLMLAQQLLQQTQLPMADVAMASGFGSIRRFNETFLALFGRPPTALRRKQGQAVTAHHDTDITLRLAYHPPYDWPRLLAFLKTRAIPGVEHVDDDAYWRVIDLRDAARPDAPPHRGIGFLEVRHLPEQLCLAVKVRCPRLDRLPAIIARVRRMFDLDADSVAIEAALSRDPRLQALIAAQPGLRLPGAWDPFETAVRAILGQQITVAGAIRLAGQFATSMGHPLDAFGMRAPHPALTHVFPRPTEVTAAGLHPLGMPGARKAALEALARQVSAQPQLLQPAPTLEEAVARLSAQPGIGEWTAQYIAMRGLHESDAFLAGDIGVQRAMAIDGIRPSAKALLAHAEAWRPWRAYAVLHLWTSET